MVYNQAHPLYGFIANVAQTNFLITLYYTDVMIRWRQLRESGRPPGPGPGPGNSH